MKQEEQQSGLDYFWRQVSKYLDEYQKDLFTKFYENAKVIEKKSKSKIFQYKPNIIINLTVEPARHFRWLLNG